MTKTWRNGAQLVFACFSFFAAAGCSITVEKSTEVLVIPANSKEIHLYNLFEGISASEYEQLPDDVPEADRVENRESKLRDSKRDLDKLKERQFTFLGFNVAGKNELLDFCKVEDLRFFTNPERKRQLCMDRRVTIRDREAFAKCANKFISAWVKDMFKEDDEKSLLKKLKDEAEQRKKKSWEHELDLFSLQLFKLASEKGFRWLRFEDEAIHFVIPVSSECASRIIANPETKEGFKKLKLGLGAAQLTATDEGIVFIMGKKGEAIRWSSSGPDKYRPDDEQALIKHAGSPKALILDGKQATSEQLIEQFIREKSKR